MIPPIGENRLRLILGISSFATVSFLLCIFRLISFFIMPSLFFDLLFIGFPIGAFLGTRYFKTSFDNFGRSLWLLHAIMIATLAVCLACKHADYFRAQFFDLNTNALFLQMTAFSLMLFPFFCAYGLSEYLGYQVGRSLLRGRMRVVYTAYLFGAAAAYFFVHFGVEWIGIARIMILGIALNILIAAFIGSFRKLAVVEALFLLAILGVPHLEARFLDLYKGTYDLKSGMSTKGLMAYSDHWKPIYQRWGRYSLCEVLESEPDQQLIGFYNDILQWDYVRPTGISYASLDALPFLLVPKGGKALIIGAGGGRQVGWARQFDLSEIAAVELEPEIFRITRQKFPDKFDRVYEEAPVKPIRMEGRTFLTQEKTRYDLIFMPSVGGFPQMMLEPGNMTRTLEAYELMKERLTPRGVLAIWYSETLDPKRFLTQQYVDTLRHIGLHASWYENPAEILILSSRISEQSVLSQAQVDAFLKDSGKHFGSDPNPDMVPRLVRYDGAPNFTPITDDKPFLAGNVVYALSLEQVHKIFAVLVLVLAIISMITAFCLRKPGDPRMTGVPYPVLVVLSFLVGLNFMVMEHSLVTVLFRSNYVFYDSLVIGAVSFLVLTGVGSIFLDRRWRSAGCIVCVLSLAALLIKGHDLPPWAVFSLFAPIAVTLGSFFPSLFESANRNPLIVFAMDAVGAAMGSVFSFFIPIGYGLNRFFTASMVVELVTLASMVWFWSRFRRRHPTAQEI